MGYRLLLACLGVLLALSGPFAASAETKAVPGSQAEIQLSFAPVVK